MITGVGFVAVSVPLQLWCHSDFVLVPATVLLVRLNRPGETPNLWMRTDGHAPWGCGVNPVPKGPD